MDINQIKQAHPEWSKFSDSQVVDMVHQLDYPDLTREQVAQGLGVTLEQPKQPDLPGRGVTGWAKDIGISALKGAIAVPEAAVGLADMVSGGRAGKALEEVGFRPAEAKAILDEQYTDQTKQAQANVQKAEGVMGTLGAVIDNPSVIPLAVAESAPLMGGGGAAAQGIMRVAPRLGVLGAAAAGEGVVSAGSSAEQIRQQTADGLLTGEQAAIASTIGALTAGLGALGGKVAKKFGISDVDTMLAQGSLDAGVRKGIVRSTLEGAASEGLLEELPQSVQEQALQNLALGKPIDEGVDQAAVLGALTGAAMGGAAGVVARPRLPNNGPLSRGANLALDRMDVEAAQVGQPAPGLSEGQYNQAMDGIMAQGDADMKALKQAGFMDKGPSAYVNAAGAPSMGSPGVDPLAQSEQPFDALADRIMTTRETLSDEGNRQAIREKFGDQALQEALYYLNQADRPGQIPDQTRDNMLAMAEEIVSRSRLTPMEQPGGLGAEPFAPAERIGMDAGVPQIGLDTEQTGVFRADAAGNVAPETNADRIDTQQATSAKKERTQGGPGMEAMTPRDTMRGAGPGVMVGEGVLTPAERPARQQPAAGPVPRLVYRPNGEPFKNQRAAVLEQRRVGGDVVPVEGGWAVQTQGETDDVRGGETVGAAERTGADGAPDAVASVGSDGRGPADGGVAVDERGGASAGRDGAGVGRAGAVPGGSADRGIGEALKRKTPAFLKSKTIPEMTDEELTEAQAFYGPKHKRAKTIEKEMAKRAPKVPAVVEPKPSAPAAKQMTMQDMAKPLGDALREGGWSAFTKLREQFAGNNNLTVRQTLDLNDLTRAAVGVEFFNTEYAKADPEKAGRVAHSNGEAPIPPAGLSEDQKARWLAAWDEGKARKDEQEPAARQPGEVVAEATEVSEPEALPAPETNEGAQDGQQVQGQAPAEEVGASAADKVIGEKINDEWTAFSEESGTLGIPRDEMPQIKAEHRGALVNFLNARGIEHAQEEVDPATLKPTQAEFSPAKVEQAKAFTGGDRSILASEDSHVLDGHHQWMAKLEAGEPVKLIRLMAPIRTLLEQVKQFPSAEQDQASAQAPEKQDDAQIAQPEPQATDNDRDSFSVERPDKEGSKVERISFERGEYIKVHISDKQSDFGEIDGISQAKREFKVKGLWYPFAYAYKADRPAEAPKKTEKLSKTIEKLNAKNGEGLTDADRVPEKKPASKTPTVDRHMEVMEAVRNGSGSLADYQASFAAVSANEDAVKAELTAKTREELLRAGGAYFHMRYKGETKPEIIEAFYAELLEEYALGKSYGPNSYIMTGGGMAAHRQRKREALKVLVEGQTQEDLDNFAKEIAARRAENKAEREARQAALANPQTLSDFRSLLNVKIREGMTRAEAFLTLTPEQRIKYDELEAESTKESREAAKRAAKTAVRSAGQTTAGEIVATKHTRDGHDLWVVKLADRLSTDDYRTVLASAKRLGGSYSSFRGNGAVPGFQFRTPEAAQAFLKLAGGDTTEAQDLAEQRRDAFDDDRSQSAVERLREMADKLEERAKEALDRDRKTNTARRARFAAAADREAQEAKALAQTMRNIAQAIDDGRAKFLDGVRTKSQVELLRGRVVAAKQEELRAKYTSYADQEKRKGEPATAETADFAEFPTFSAFRSDLASLARQMLEVDGTKKLGQQLMSVADDVTDAYIDFAKKPENLHKLSTFSIRQGDDVKAAIFPSKDAAERAIRRSGLADRAIVLAEKRGVNRIIMSPSEAMSRGVWTGDGDKRITLTVDAGAALVQAIGRRGNKTNRLTVPWQFQTAYDRLNALKRIGIETPSEYRSALREFIGLQERAIVNKVREMELAMTGRKNDGLDFFPTPAEVADQMVAAADIGPDMAVLEPSAGMGHIADRIREAGAEPDVIELAEDRRELLQEKGYNLADARDFLDMKPRQFFTYGDVFRAPDGTEGVLRSQGGMGSNRVRLVSEDGAELGKFDRDELTGIRHRGAESGYDRIIMNPPFSNGRDIEHVMHAYDLLKPGGRIVAIMGESAFFNQSKKAEAFRQWLDDKGGTSEKLPAGSFMDPSLPVNTGVNARMVVIDKADSAGSASESQADAGFSRTTAQSTEEENALKALSENDDLFRLPKSEGTTVEAITADNDPSIKVKKLQGIPGRTEYQFTMPNGKTARMVVRPANPYGANTYGFDYVDGETSNVLDVRPGDNPEGVDPDKEDVWIDVSLLSSGQEGARIYNIAATYAHNTGRIFIGDPAGLSDDALIRRPEQMLSSALKFGTTEHLAPHPRQITGDDRLGVPSLRWVYGDHIGNIKRLIDVNLKVAENVGLDEITFDPTDGSFRDSEGGDLGREGIQALAVGAGYGRAAGAGANTLARGAVLRALLRKEGGAGKGQVGGRDGLLARLVSVSAAHDEATKRVFYSREGVSQPESGDGSRRQNAIAANAHMDMVEDLVKQLTKRWKNAPEIVVLRSMDEAPDAVRAENERQIAGGATGEPEAFYHQGKAYLLASHMRSMADVRRTVFHEVLGHLGLRGLYGAEMGAILDQVARARRADVLAKAKQYGYDAGSQQGMRAAAEEFLASLAEKSPQVGFVRRAIAAIRAWMRRNVPALAEMRMTDADIISELILPVRRFIKRGPPGGGLSLAPSFSRDNADGRPMFSRSAAAADFTRVARESVQDFFGSAGAQVDWLDRTFKTQYAKAQKFPAFRAVFNKLQDYIEGVSTLANEAADNAPSILPKLEDWRDLAKTGLKEADAKAVAAPIFEGTLSWARVRGQLVPMDEAVSQGFDGEAGVVFTDKELRDQFKLTDEQVGYYREFRAAVDESLDQLVSTEVIRLLGDVPPAVKAMAMTREGRAGLRGAITAAFENQEDPLLKQINDKFDHIDRMKARGYAPLSRFGKFWVHVVDRDGQTQYFGMAETRSEANRLARTLREEFPGAAVEQGVMSQEFHKLMSAVPVDAMELFASAIGADQSEVFQKYIQLAKNNRSTMKRLIKRKGTAGFSDDVPRVLASFVTSNARAASTALNVKDAKDLARDIRDGDIKDEAIKLIESVTEPEESGAAIRGVMFTNFIGGSIASAVVNITQPFMMTLPYLSQWGGAVKAAGRLVDAARMVATGVDESSEIGKALKRAEIEGVVSPQEIHHLIDRAAGGIGSKNLYLKKLALLWSGPFSVAEQFNRRVSFLAAYQTAQAEGIANPFGFAEKAVIETQGLYNAGNKPNVARGAIGATAMTFKQYSIHYLEWLARMAKSGPDGKKAAALALVLLMMAAGTDGLPFMDDMDDVFDTVGQAMGYDTNTKRARREAVASVLGEELAEVATRGFSAAAGFPVDLSVRMGMGNLLPATDLLLKSNTDTARSLAEIAGPGGAMFTQYRDAARELLGGDIGGAIQKASPVALQNLMKAAKMAETGEYRDQRDRKVTDVDGLDVGMKALSFQPAQIARESTRMAEARQSESLAKTVENEITDKWARAIADGDREAEKEALKMRDDWNEKNPGQPIVVKRSQAVRKARNMKMERRDRFLKTVSPERRALVDQEIS